MVLTFTPVLYGIAWDINRAGNRGSQSVKYVSDPEQYGKREHWAVPKKFNPQGDCEDIALFKSRGLIEAGIPWDHQAIGYCMTEPVIHPDDGKRRRAAHAVLLLITNRGDFVLDNRHHDMLQYQDVEDLYNYKFLYRSRPGQSLADPWEIIVKKKG